jgi:hypothetical protein
MRWTLLLLCLLFAAPAAAAPFGVGVAGLARGAARFEMSFDYGKRSMDLTTEGADEAQRVSIDAGGFSWAFELEPFKYLALDARFLLHEPRIDALNYAGPMGWGFGGTAKVTPLHVAHDLLHVGVYGAFDGQLVGLPTDDAAAMRLYHLRAGLGVGLGNADDGWYVDLGVHYARSWGELVLQEEEQVEVEDDEGNLSLETQVNDVGYDALLPRPVGVRLGAGFFSSPIAPAHNTRSRVRAGLEVRLIDEWALTLRVGVIL